MTSSGVILARAVDKWQPSYANQSLPVIHAFTRKTTIDLSKMGADSLRYLVVVWIILSAKRAVLGQFLSRLNILRLLGRFVLQLFQISSDGRELSFIMRLAVTPLNYFQFRFLTGTSIELSVSSIRESYRQLSKDLSIVLE